VLVPDNLSYLNGSYASSFGKKKLATLLLLLLLLLLYLISKVVEYRWAGYLGCKNGRRGGGLFFCGYVSLEGGYVLLVMYYLGYVEVSLLMCDTGRFYFKGYSWVNGWIDRRDEDSFLWRGEEDMFISHVLPGLCGGFFVNVQYW
jgi:hypothetical protein